jgi:hypothetical protein
MFQCGAGFFACAQVILFAVRDGCSPVCVRGKFVKFGGSLV